MHEPVDLPIRTLEASETHQHWGELLATVARRQTRIIVAESGVPVAAIISADDLARLDQLERQRAERFRILDRIGEVFRDESPEESERLAIQAVAEARETHRRQQAAPES